MPHYAPEPEQQNDLDPGASTQLFQAFVDRYEPGGSTTSRPRVGLVIAAVIGLLLVVAIAALLIAH